MAKAGRKRENEVSLARVASGAACLKIEYTDVENPLALKPGEKITVARNLTPLNDLAKRGRLDVAQRRAGEIFAENYSHAELGGAKAIDYTREHVDGGAALDPLSEQQQDALDWLRKARRYPGIGKQGYAILRAVCGEEKTIAICAKQFSMSRGGGYGVASQLRAEQSFVVFRLIEALDCLVEMLGLIGKGADKARMKAEHGDNLAQFGAEYEIGNLGDLVLKKTA
jgi:hypothetical protein